MRTRPLAPLCTALLLAGAARAQTARPMTPDAWREDLRFLDRELRRRHANLFHTVTPERWAAEVAALDSAIPRLDDDEVVARMKRLVALVGDGHTGLAVPGRVRTYPLVVRRFGDTLRVVRTAPEHRRALGGVLLRVGEMDALAAFDSLAALAPKGETEGWVRVLAQGYLVRPELLHGFGIVPQARAARFTVRTDAGEEVALTLAPVAADSAAWVDAYPRPPLYLTRRDEPLWRTALPDGRTFYVGFNAYPSTVDLRRFTEETVREMAAAGATRLVIDLRGNGGGDYTRVRGGMIPVLQRAGFGARGRLYVLTGPRTFSAAMNNAADFRSMLRAVLAGEPTGARPNGYQENDGMRLPNSGIEVGFSTRYYRFQDEDTPGVLPDQRIEPTWADYAAGRDPVLEWVLAQPLARQERASTGTLAIAGSPVSVPGTQIPGTAQAKHPSSFAKYMM